MPLLLRHWHKQCADFSIPACLLVRLCKGDGTRLDSAAACLSACIAHLPPPLQGITLLSRTHTHTSNVFRPYTSLGSHIITSLFCLRMQLTHVRVPVHAMQCCLCSCKTCCRQSSSVGSRSKMARSSSFTCCRTCCRKVPNLSRQVALGNLPAFGCLLLGRLRLGARLCACFASLSRRAWSAAVACRQIHYEEFSVPGRSLACASPRATAVLRSARFFCGGPATLNPKP